MSYKLLNYATERGPRAGILVGTQVHDVAALLERQEIVSTEDVLENWTVIDNEIRRRVGTKPTLGLALGETKLLAPLLRPGTIYIAGANYQDHVAEMERGGAVVPQLSAPYHAMKAGRATIVGPDATVRLPRASLKIDWEVELAAIIGVEAKNVTPVDALKHVAGYAVANDLSCRDLSRRSDAVSASPFHYDWVAHKCFDGACPLGPWMTPAAAIEDPQSLSISLHLNGSKKQESNTRHMIFPIAEQVSTLSHRITLYPGDIILSGTPGGTGASHGRFLQPGDEIVTQIEGLGWLRTFFV